MGIYKPGAAIVLALLLSACETLGYYGQAVSGHVSLLVQRRSVTNLLNDPETEPQLQAKLLAINQIRDFAGSALQLPVGKNYSYYVPLERPYVVWNVFAAPEFSLTPHSWCFPVAGCVSYRGYYSEAAARKFAATLQARGEEVYVGGVAAYSTLGWFTDPLLGSVIQRADWQLASLLFHELAHQVVYVPGDTEFNESFATSVEQAGLQLWLQSNAKADGPAVLAAARASEVRQAEFVALVQAAVADLQQLYASGQSEVLMRAAKTRRLQTLRSDYRELVEQWGGYQGYDNWFTQDLNNAQLSTVATYNALVPVFTALLESAGSFPAYYREVQALAALDPQERAAQLTQLQTVLTKKGTEAFNSTQLRLR